MTRNLLHNVFSSPIALHLKSLRRLSLGLFLGLGGGLLVFVDGAVAADTINLTYQDKSVTVTLDEIRNYAETGEASADFQEFIGSDQELANIVSQLLVEQITLTESFRERVRADLRSSSLGQFLVAQIQKFIQESDLTDLENALTASLEDDNRLSIVEVIDNVSTDSLSVNLTEVGVVYNDVRGFVERVLPALEVARDYLQDAICECPQSTTDATTDTTEDTTDTPASSDNEPSGSEPSNAPDAPSNDESSDSPQSWNGTGNSSVAVSENCQTTTATVTEPFNASTAPLN